MKIIDVNDHVCFVNKEQVAVVKLHLTMQPVRGCKHDYIPVRVTDRIGHKISGVFDRCHHCGNLIEARWRLGNEVPKTAGIFDFVIDYNNTSMSAAIFQWTALKNSKGTTRGKIIERIRRHTATEEELREQAIERIIFILIPRLQQL